MTEIQTYSVEMGLTKMMKGLSIAQKSLSHTDEESQMLLSIVNGEIGDGYTQEQYTKCFSRSFDEEVSEFSVFVEEFLNHNIPTVTLPTFDNHLKTLSEGLNLAIEGLEEVLQSTVENPELKKKLKNFSSSNGYSPFKDYGFSRFLIHLKGFRWAFFAAIAKEIGHYQLNKKLSK